MTDWVTHTCKGNFTYRCGACWAGAYSENDEELTANLRAIGYPPLPQEFLADYLTFLDDARRDLYTARSEVVTRMFRVEQRLADEIAGTKRKIVDGLQTKT